MGKVQAGVASGAMAVLLGLGIAAAAGNSISITTSGKLTGATQSLNGKNDANSITARGDYTWTMSLDLATLSCPQQPGAIPWESGLVAFVQGHTPRSGALNLNYSKPSGDPNRVDFWETNISPYDYRVQIFRWSSENSVNNLDGSTTVFYRGGSIEVFKKQAGRIVSREQCFGNYVDYDLTAL